MPDLTPATRAQTKIIKCLREGWELWAIIREPEDICRFSGWLHHARMLQPAPGGGVVPFPGNSVSGVLVTRMVDADMLFLTNSAGGNDRQIVLPDDPIAESDRLYLEQDRMR